MTNSAMTYTRWLQRSMPDAIRSTISSGNICESFRSIFLLSSVMYAQYTPSSKRNLSSKILRKSQQQIYKHIQKRPPGKGWSHYIYVGKKYYSLNLAARNSLFKRAICSTEIPLGHSISQALVLVQLPKPSSSIFATIARALLAASGRP